MYSTKASRCQDFIAAAKDGEWDQLREILGRHPGYAGLRVHGAARRRTARQRVKGFSHGK